MKKKYAATLLGTMSLALISANSQATVTIDDNYIGGMEIPNVGIVPETNDIIGTAGNYDVTRMEVTISSPSSLDVKIYSRYFNNIGHGGTQLGDLFISNDGWNPFGAAPYGSDVPSNGEDWEYALVLDDHLANSGSLSLYSVDVNDIVTSSGTSGYRPGQEVQYSTSSAALGTGSWWIDYNNTSDDSDDFLQFSFSGYDMGISEDLFGMRWTMTCANDIIEGGAPVPEPATMLLFGAGLAGLVGNARRKRKK